MINLNFLLWRYNHTNKLRDGTVLMGGNAHIPKVHTLEFGDKQAFLLEQMHTTAQMLQLAPGYSTWTVELISEAKPPVNGAS